MNRPGVHPSELFIVDNSATDWKAVNYLREWSEFAARLDIASAYFEIGALLAMGEEWQRIDKIRLLIGDEVSKRTRKAFELGLRDLRTRLDASIEREKEANDFLTGVPAIAAALARGQIECRVYRRDKFHAKAYITHSRREVVPSAALVGSSNFTRPGLTDNVELNVRLLGTEVAVLQEWYERHWEDAEDVSAELLRTVERHVREFTPYEVFAQSLHHLFRDSPSSAKDWEEQGIDRGGSRVFKLLDRYQQDGYRSIVSIAERHNGAFLCDGVGLGKTFIGMMLLERLVVHEKKSVALIVPKAARKAVWEAALRDHCPDLLDPSFNRLEIINHTDITREPSGDRDWPGVMRSIQQKADAIVIDEAHHFRNPGVQVDVDPGNPSRLIARDGRKPSRYRRLYHMLEPGPRGPKQLYLLTATPVNNHINDLRHMIELFSRKADNHFESLGVHSLKGHFLKLEKSIEEKVRASETETDSNEPAIPDAKDAEEVLDNDTLFRSLVVQRSRGYVRESQKLEHGRTTQFPNREDPRVAEYDVRKVYGELLDMLERAFSKKAPLFRLAIYNPAAYERRPEDSKEAKIEANRQLQVIGLVRTNFLKRFESSAKSFEASCERLLLKLLAWARVHSESAHEKDRLDKWSHRFDQTLGIVDANQKISERHQKVLFGDDEPEDDLITDEMLEAVTRLSREQYQVEDMLGDTIDDLNQIVEFLVHLYKLKPRDDDKLRKLRDLLQKDPDLKGRKVLIFTEFADTARHIGNQLTEAGIQDLVVIDGGTSPDNRVSVIRRFAPYYNGSSSADLAQRGEAEIRTLISTDVLSEGLNLQDATRLINYDLHWNPVRLMQRIGRVDRRMNPTFEKRLTKDHPDAAPDRGRVVYWNFLPPKDLDRLLRLYKRVSHKTLRISKVFGIEGRKLLRPDDDYEALQDFNHEYEGTESPRERLLLEYEKLLQSDPSLASHLDALPGRIFSGRELEAASQNAIAAPLVFFCYALPGRAAGVPDDAPLEQRWTEQAGETIWRLFDPKAGKVVEESPTAIVNSIRSTPETPRRVMAKPVTLIDARKEVEKHILQTSLRRIDAPAGVRARLVAWMELN